MREDWRWKPRYPRPDIKPCANMSSWRTGYWETRLGESWITSWITLRIRLLVEHEVKTVFDEKPDLEVQDYARGFIDRAKVKVESNKI